jgi:hypothetical protein
VTLFAVKNHFRYDIIHRIFEGGMGMVMMLCGFTNAPCK